LTFKISGKNFLVTGGTGQIGSFLSEKLLDKKANVTIIGRDNTNLKEIKNLVDAKKIKFIECDLTNESRIKTISPLIQNTDFLVHLSSEFRYAEPNSIRSAHQTVDLNLKGTIWLLRQLKELKGILFTSTVAVYGKPPHMPVDESCQINPISFYGSSKFAAENYLRIYSNHNKIPLTILRISTIYGERNRSDQVIPIFIGKALRNEPIKLYGNGSRDFIHISDVIEAIMNAIGRNESDLINIGTGKKFSIEWILKKIIEISKSQSEILHLEKSTDYDFVCDISRAKTKLSFTPKISIERGLDDEVFWHKNNQ
tara:strand:- start:170 stop:1105 length:936 start_codon:yes stop_codon:yes gene_type:complete